MTNEMTLRRFWKRGAIWKAALLGLVWLAGGTLPGYASPFTPVEWRREARLPDGTVVTGKLVGWNRDDNRNFVDDVADRMVAEHEAAGLADADAKKIDIIVDFNRCVICNDKEEEEVISFLRTLGTVEHVAKSVTFAVVSGVSILDLAQIAARDEVAMVEFRDVTTLALNTSVQAIRVRASTTFSPQTVEDAFPTIDGSGVNIAVLDTGVDNAGGTGTTHVMFPAGTFVGGADCLAGPCTLGDPDDDHSHGTHVAGIALGRSFTCGGNTCRGVAPAAGLVDIKICDFQGSCPAGAPERGVDLAIQNRDLWNLKVLNLSIQNCQASNGLNAAAQLLNTAVSHGLAVVVAAGNTGNCSLPNGTALINDWASASNAITVASASDGGTVPLSNDTLSGFSFRGPRLSDGDGDPRDEQKPEISAPGQSITSARFDTTNSTLTVNGTSQAAPHVSGAAALLIESTPTINPGSLKEVLINTAVQSNKPGPHPGYDIGWGFGFLNLHAGLSRTLVTDVGRPTEPPYTPCNADWCSPHISTATPPIINVANTITAQVRNHTATAANNVRVCFGAYVFSNNFNQFFEFGCTFVNIPGNTTQSVSFPWTPGVEMIPPGFPANDAIHSCLKVSIDYAFDTVYTNNGMQRNVSIAQASVARVNFRLENNETKPVNVKLQIENKSKWAVRVFENGVQLKNFDFTLAPDDCPHDLIIEIEPPADAPWGDKAQIIVRAVTEDGKDFGGIVIDGIHEEHEERGERVAAAKKPTMLPAPPPKKGAPEVRSSVGKAPDKK